MNLINQHNDLMRYFVERLKFFFKFTCVFKYARLA